MKKLLILSLAMFTSALLLPSSGKEISPTFSHDDIARHARGEQAIGNEAQFDYWLKTDFIYMQKPYLSADHLTSTIAKKTNTLDQEKKNFTDSHTNCWFGKVNRGLMAKAFGWMAAGAAGIGAITYSCYTGKMPDNVLIESMCILAGISSIRSIYEGSKDARIACDYPKYFDREKEILKSHGAGLTENLGIMNEYVKKQESKEINVLKKQNAKLTKKLDTITQKYAFLSQQVSNYHIFQGLSVLNYDKINNQPDLKISHNNKESVI